MVACIIHRCHAFHVFFSQLLQCAKAVCAGYYWVLLVTLTAELFKVGQEGVAEILQDSGSELCACSGYAVLRRLRTAAAVSGFTGKPARGNCDCAAAAARLTQTTTSKFNAVTYLLTFLQTYFFFQTRRGLAFFS